ncbi:hypothetical protein [Variovorax sp. LT1R16]|uniref:hypothetical protein n=1 Tax=Variovorax sp. LT1R16 TaxID=3443728 RepID=UPI003F44B3B5
MAYMNTERDNFYDWAKDKTDSTGFSTLSPSTLPARRAAPTRSPWVSLAMVAVVVIASSMAYHFFLG